MRRLEFFEIEILSAHAEILDDVADNASWHISRMPGKSNQAFRSKRVGIVPVTARRAEEVAADFLEPALELPTVP